MQCIWNSWVFVPAQNFWVDGVFCSFKLQLHFVALETTDVVAVKS